MLMLFRALMGLPQKQEDQPPVEGLPKPDEGQEGPIDSAATEQPQPAQE